MPIKPTPHRYHCPKCGWNKVFAPDSDVLLELPPESCAKCGHAPLDRQEISGISLSGFLSRLNEAIARK